MTKDERKRFLEQITRKGHVDMKNAEDTLKSIPSTKIFVKFGPKTKNAQILLKFGALINSSILNSMIE